MSQNIVIIGGGAAGAQVAKDLAAKLNPSTHTLTLVTARPFFVNLPALIRTSVTAEGGLEDLILMPYADFLVAPKPHPSGTEKFKGTIKIGKAVSFTSEDNGGEVVLEGGERLPYSILVIATGNTWNGPLNLPDGDFVNSKTYLDEWRAKFQAAKDVVLVGGGSVGVEYAGEILDFYPVRSPTPSFGRVLIDICRKPR
jgi:apoptosis-inducing factor 2